MAKRHNLRQRKKLHIGEFKELGFNIELCLRDGLGDAGENALIEAFFDEVIDPRGLIYGGGLGYGFVCRDRRGDATEEDRAAVRDWLSNRPEVVSVTVSELVDAWK